jgi:hypothetical protein
MYLNFSQFNQAIKDTALTAKAIQAERLVSLSRLASTIANTLPDEWGRSYAGVQQLEYSASGLIQDVTPQEAITVPNSLVAKYVGLVTEAKHEMQVVKDDFNSIPLQLTRNRSWTWYDNTWHDQDENVDSAIGVFCIKVSSSNWIWVTAYTDNHNVPGVRIRNETFAATDSQYTMIDYLTSNTRIVPKLLRVRVDDNKYHIIVLAASQEGNAGAVTIYDASNGRYTYFNPNASMPVETTYPIMVLNAQSSLPQMIEDVQMSTSVDVVQFLGLSEFDDKLTALQNLG